MRAKDLVYNANQKGVYIPISHIRYWTNRWKLL